MNLSKISLALPLRIMPINCIHPTLSTIHPKPHDIRYEKCIYLDLVMSIHIIFDIIYLLSIFQFRINNSVKRFKSIGLLGIEVDTVLSSAYNVYLNKLEQFGR